jgi:hypothetical protein
MAKATPRKKITLNGIVKELDATTKELGQVYKTLAGTEAKELNLRIKALHKVRKELLVICRHAYPVFPPVRVGKKKR